MTEPAVPIDNPAGRLYDILNRIKQSNSGWTVVYALPGILLVDPNDAIGVFYAFTQLKGLIDDTDLAIEKLEGYKYKRYQKMIERIKIAFQDLNYEVKLQDILKYLNDDTLLSLKHCAEDLSGTEIYIDGDALKELQAEVNSLLEKVIESNELGKEIRTFLYEKLQEIDKAIGDYRFYGAVGIRRAFESSLGAALINQEQIQEQKENKLVKEFFKVLIKIDSILSPFVKAKQLIPPGMIQFFLKSGNSDS
jgi:hypothetical protein